MHDLEAQMINEKLESIELKLDRLVDAVHGDGGEKLGLVRRVDAHGFGIKALRGRVKFYSWVVGVVFSAFVAAGANHWFESHSSAQQHSGQSK